MEKYFETAKTIPSSSDFVLLFISICGLVVSYALGYRLSVLIFHVQAVADSARGSTFKPVSVSFCLDFVVLWALPCFLA